MASPTPLELTKMADCYPGLYGWAQYGGHFGTYVTFNGPNLSRNASVFPLMARVRVYEKGKLVGETFSPQIAADKFCVVDLAQASAGKEVKDGLLEVHVFSLSETGISNGYYNEVWGAVVSDDGKTEVNFPVMIGRGADPSMVDSSYLYYPGVVVDDRFSCEMLALNHQDRENQFDVTLTHGDGGKKLTKTFTIPPKTLMRVDLAKDLGSDAQSFLEGKPGMLVFHYQYKMNCYIQTLQRQKGIVYGMDHLGLLLGGKNKVGEIDKVERTRRLVNRPQDELVCYCCSVSTSELKEMTACGMNLSEIQQKTCAGTVCQGCVPDLERVTGQKVTRQ